MGQAEAQRARGPASEFLRRRHDAVTSALRRAAATEAARLERSAAVGDLLDQLLDFDELGRRSLEAHWATLTEAQRARFVDLLRRLIQRSYQRNLESTLDYRVQYAGEAPSGDGVLVRTTARSRLRPREPAIQIDYLLAARGDRWVVLDITTDSVSMARNYRSQFTRIYERDGFDRLIERMERRLASAQEL